MTSAIAPPRESCRHSRETLLVAVAGCWALLFGMSVNSMGNGLMATLLGLRATREGFSHMAIGLIMSGHFIGYTMGSVFTSRLVERVGHIRVFAALASVASAVALLYSLLLTPASWFCLRFVYGFCLAGLFVVAESWLNESIANEHRGRLLSIYMVVQLAGLSAGPLLVNLATPLGFSLFILGSVIFSVALVPILLTQGPVPDFRVHSPLKFRDLWSAAPLGVVGCTVTGISNGTFLGFCAVYGEGVGMSVGRVSVFMFVAIVGALALQWPLGALSDRMDRRWVLTGVTTGAAVVAGAAMFTNPLGPVLPLVLAALFGGLTFPMYSLSLSIANDRLSREQMVAASSQLVLATGLGSILGPPLEGLAMKTWGSHGFFGLFFIVHAALGVYCLYRIVAFAAVPVEEQGAFVYLNRTSPVAAAAAFDRDEVAAGGDTSGR